MSYSNIKWTHLEFFFEKDLVHIILSYVLYSFDKTWGYTELQNKKISSNRSALDNFLYLKYINKFETLVQDDQIYQAYRVLYVNFLQSA